MEGPWQLAAFGAVPALLAMAYFDWLDAKRPEPRRTLRLVAFAGALGAIPVYGISLLLAGLVPELEGTYLGATYVSFIVVAIPEEAAKLGGVLLVAWKRAEFDERMDGIVYGARAGLGFALVENIVYLLLIPSSVGEYLSIFIGRALLAVPGHAIWGGIAGYYAARRRFDRDGPGLPGGYAIAVLMHGAYDTLLFSVPIALAAGHTWIVAGIFGVPLMAYAAPAVVIGGGALHLRALSRRAIAADDRDEAARERARI